MKPPKRYSSKRFEEPDDVIKYFKEAGESPLMDAIMFLAYRIQCAQYNHDLLYSGVQGVINEVAKDKPKKDARTRRHTVK